MTCAIHSTVGLWQSTSLTRYARSCLLICLLSYFLPHLCSLTSPPSPPLPHLPSLTSPPSPPLPHLPSLTSSLPSPPPHLPSPPSLLLLHLLPPQLALRAGNEKDADESADTVGCCSLRVEHISEHPTALVPPSSSFLSLLPCLCTLANALI